MSSLFNRDVNDTYKDLLQIDNSNAGVDGSLRNVEDGEGTVSALQISTAGIKSTGTFTVTGASTFIGAITLSSTFTYGSYTVAFGGNFSIAGAFTLSGAYSFTGTLSAATTITFPVTGTLSTLAGTETLSNKTLTSPKINQILDTNGNELVIFSTAASAVNEITVTNAATGNYPKSMSTGGDTNINYGVQSKGTGSVYILSENTSTPFVIFSGTSLQHQSNFIFSNTSANRNITFQDATHTVVGRDTTDILTNKTLTSPTVNTPTINQAVSNGFIDGSAASAGAIGELLSGTASTVSITSTTTKTITSVTLTAGRWRVSANFQITPSSSLSSVIVGISKTTNTRGASLAIDESESIIQTTFTSANAQVLPTRETFISVSGSTTLYAVVTAAFASTATASAIIIAQRY